VGRVQWSGQAHRPNALHRKCIMANEDRTRGRTASHAGGPRKKTSEERPFDLWLQKQLHAMYDEIASEPLPEDLVGLIGRDAAATRDTQPNPPRETRNKNSNKK
jgi:hypothetical protein